MNVMHTYRAPWGSSLKAISTIVSVLSIGLLLLPHLRQHWMSLIWVQAVLPTIVAVCALFTVRGYRVESGVLVIERLLWGTRIPLDGLLSATVEPRAMRCSIRTFGNGGMFSFTGFYWSPGLGHYRAFVTDLSRTVVLRFVTRTIVISPDDPEEMVRELSHHQ